MTRSMTGFGKAACEFAGETVTIELGSVNHRYLDCHVRMPNGWSALEPVIKQTLKKRVARGKVNVSIQRKRSRSAVTGVRFDATIAEQYIAGSRELAVMLGGDGVLSLDALVRLDGVFVAEEPVEDLTEAQDTLLTCLDKALEPFNAMRETEGAVLEDDLRQRVGFMRERLAEIEQRLPELNRLQEERLRERIRDLAAEVTVTEERIAIEVAILADKGDVTEEIVRLKTHLDHVEEIVERDDPVGRRLDFLSQEIQREVNTLGVKTRDADVAKVVLDMKSELEKIREQVQNIE
ncbi:MAG: YicC family protein [bacterium]|nr:YicC family protein [bacterium]